MGCEVLNFTTFFSYLYVGKEYQDYGVGRFGSLGLYDFGARYLSSRMGRWTSIDPKADSYYSLSPYSYCANNPMIFIDPDGESWYRDQYYNYVFVPHVGGEEHGSHGINIPDNYTYVGEFFIENGWYYDSEGAIWDMGNSPEAIAILGADYYRALLKSGDMLNAGRLKNMIDKSKDDVKLANNLASSLIDIMGELNKSNKLLKFANKGTKGLNYYFIFSDTYDLFSKDNKSFFDYFDWGVNVSSAFSGYWGSSAASYWQAAKFLEKNKPLAERQGTQIMFGKYLDAFR